MKADDDGELEGLFDLTPETMAQLMKEGDNVWTHLEGYLASGHRTK